MKRLQAYKFELMPNGERMTRVQVCGFVSVCIQQGFVVAIPPQHTSQRCSCCGYVSRNNRQTQAKFECVECGHSENADINPRPLGRGGCQFPETD